MNLNFTLLQQLFTEHLKTHLRQVTPHHSITDVYAYALFPPGKLFRPLLAHCLYLDFLENPTNHINDLNENPISNLSYFRSFLEMHHAYTLIHDDLPCMDDDDFRRNRPSTHRQFNEWKALLVGDGLITASYQLVSHIRTPHLPHLFKFLFWCLGPKGLIQGQVLDLTQSSQLQNFSTILKIHALKTGRLFQASLIGSFNLVPDNQRKNFPHTPYRMNRELFKYGLHLGYLFQLLDDLVDLSTLNPHSHESKINPFMHYPEESFATIYQAQKFLNDCKEKFHLHHTGQLIHSYIQLTYKELENNKDKLDFFFGQNSSPQALTLFKKLVEMIN